MKQHYHTQIITEGYKLYVYSLFSNRHTCLCA